jgi:hypothetical protein
VTGGFSLPLEIKGGVNQKTEEKRARSAEFAAYQARFQSLRAVLTSFS